MGFPAEGYGLWVMEPYGLWSAFPRPPSRWTGRAMGYHGYGFSQVWVKTGLTVLNNWKCLCLQLERLDQSLRIINQGGAPLGLIVIIVIKIVLE